MDLTSRSSKFNTVLGSDQTTEMQQRSCHLSVDGHCRKNQGFRGEIKAQPLRR